MAELDLTFPGLRLRPVNQRIWMIGALAALAYFTVVGGTPIGELYGGFRVINALVAAGFVIAYFVVAPVRADAVDRAALVALLLFAVAALLSEFPRQSFDAILAMTTFAAVFFFARSLAGRSGSHRLIYSTLMGLSLATTMVAVASLLATIIDWTGATDGKVGIPLAMPFSTWPWGNRYDLVLLAVMLFPSWMSGEPGRVRRVISIAVGLALLFLVLYTGSRNIWMALGAATALIAVPKAVLRWPGRRRVWWFMAALFVAGIVAIVAVEPIRDRLASLTSTGQRWSMWSATLQAWWERPIAGLGPGTFPWLLQTTGYFDTQSIAPRHPDNALVQLLGEAGIIGGAGVVVLILGVGRPLIRARAAALAHWPLAVFIFAGIAANPTDLPFLVVAAITWTAIALPRCRLSATQAPPGRSRAFALASAACLLVVVVAYGSTLVAGLRYDAAYSAVGRGDLVSASEHLRGAISLDPSMALYRRQLGTLQFVQADLDASVSSLTRAVRMNPVDDLAWRTLAMSHRAAHENDQAMRAIDEAVRLQRADYTNLLLSLFMRSDAVANELTRSDLAEVALAWPSAVASAGWDRVLPVDLSTEQVIALALQRWQGQGSAPEPSVDQPLTLVVLGGRPDLVEKAVSAADLPASLRRLATAVATCAPDAAVVLDDVPIGERDSPEYWSLAVRASSDESERHRSLAAYSIRTGRPTDPDPAPTYLNPLAQNDIRDMNADRWGYRRLSLPWDDPGIPLPDPVSGSIELLAHWDEFACR